MPATTIPSTTTPKPSRLAIILDRIAQENGMWADDVAQHAPLLAPFGLECEDVQGVIGEAMQWHRAEMARIQAFAKRWNFEHS